MSATTTGSSLTETLLRDALMRFLEGFRDWVNGTVADDDETFDAFWRSAMHEHMSLVMPSGAAIDRAEARAVVRESHGSNPDYRFELSDVRVVSLGTHMGVLVCHEWQFNTLTGTRRDNGRITTAVVERDEAGKIALSHLHQTWLPDDVVEQRLGSR